MNPAEDGQEEMKVMEEQEPAPIEIASDAQDVRSKLIALVPSALKERRFDQVLLSSATLADSFGCLGEGPKESACWVFMMQSIMSRDWMLQNWSSALNPNSEVATSLRRLTELEKSHYPRKESQPQLVTELSFLESTSSAWRRLNIDADPAAILGKVPASTAFCCLQMCPTQSALYITAGIPEGASDSPFKVTGKWNMVKMDLVERDRSLLLTLVSQQRKWNEEATKFVAMFGEQVTKDQDLVGHDATFGSKIMKHERALEERMRALLSDMEQILAPALGEGAEFHTFLKNLSPDDENLSLMLFVDPSLQDLPFEGLGFCKLFGGQVGRDFSLHLFGHRLDKFDQAIVNASTIKTVLDPYQDDAGSKLDGFERESILQVVNQLQDGVAGFAKWSPLLSGQGMLSAQDWISQIEFAANASSIFVFAPGRLGNLLSPNDIATLNFENTLLLVCSDQGLNDASFRRQNSLDNAKTVTDVLRETPIKIMANLSLGGCGSIVGATWATTLTSQGRAVQRFWNSFTKHGKTTIGATAYASGLSTLAEDDALHGQSVKPWISLSRVTYGLPVKYNDA